MNFHLKDDPDNISWQNDEGLRLRNDLYCVEWGVKLYSLTRCKKEH